MPRGTHFWAHVFSEYGQVGTVEWRSGLSNSNVMQIDSKRSVGGRKAKTVVYMTGNVMMLFTIQFNP